MLNIINLNICKIFFTVSDVKIDINVYVSRTNDSMKEILSGYFDILGGEENYSKLRSCMRIENDPLITRAEGPFLGRVGRCPLSLVSAHRL